MTSMTMRAATKAKPPRRCLFVLINMCTTPLSGELSGPSGPELTVIHARNPARDTLW